MKKIVKTLLCFIIIASAFVFASHNAKAEIASGDWGTLLWSISDEGVLSISGKGAMIPFEMYSKEGWRAYLDDISSVVIGEGIVSVGDYAFMDSSIQSVKIPSSLLSVGEWAFYRCKQLNSIQLPQYVESFGNYAFAHCSKITSVSIPAAKKIPLGLFNDCASLISVTLSKGTTEIDWDAFAECSQLSSITLPETLKEIGLSAFSKCISLKEIHLPSKLERIGSKAFIDCLVLDKIEIPSSVTRIGDGAFSLHTIIKCKKNSYADTWARAAGYTVENEGVIPTGLSLNKTELDLPVSQTEALIITFEPSDTTEKDVEWSSNDTDIATVDKKVL